jgi:hypothetical protein
MRKAAWEKKAGKPISRIRNVSPLLLRKATKRLFARLYKTAQSESTVEKWDNSTRRPPGSVPRSRLDTPTRHHGTAPPRAVAMPRAFSALAIDARGPLAPSTAGPAQPSMD